MKWGSKWWIFFCVLACLWYRACSQLGNPYEILGIHKRASQAEIRKVFKQLAIEWHPDKTSDPSAGARFVEIKQAYELLSDPDRRRLYDERGITEDNFYDRPEYPPFHTSSPFDDLFSQHFNFQENDITFFHKLSITTKQFDRIIVPKSERTPHLIFFYTDWCFPCLQMAPYCRRLVDKLEPLGVNFVTVHSAREPQLARRLNFHALPCLVLLLDGDAYVYKGTITSAQKIIEFLRNKMPYKLVPRVKTGDVDDFLNGWEDNRVRGLIFEPRQNMRLRYLVIAYHFRHRVTFGFVDSDEVRANYQVPNDMDTVLLFNENTSSPMASISMRDIPTPTLHHVVSNNQYLALPRLSSQDILEALCPCEWNKPRKRLCAVLITKQTIDHDPFRQAFRVYAQNSAYGHDKKVRFAYIYQDKQHDFVTSLIREGAVDDPLLHVVVIWRRDPTHVKYEWFTDRWEHEHNRSGQKLESTIARLLRTSEALSYEAFVRDLFDEHAQGVIGRVVSRVGNYVESVYDGLNRDQLWAALSILGTVGFIVGVGYLMAYLVRLEEENVKKQNFGANNNSSSNNKNTNYEPELRLHELRAETFYGLIRLLKPGCRTILLVLDQQSRRQLIPPFHKAVWPYRKNKTLTFSIMYIEKGLSWYKELLQLSLPADRDLNINPRNCVGTVLSLNGLRKYFCMFHAKHTEARKKRRARPSAAIGAEKDCESGAFIGFDSEASESDEDILLEDNLLDGLPNWLDRLFEGTTQRYHINYWPEFPTK